MTKMSQFFTVFSFRKTEPPAILDPMFRTYLTKGFLSVSLAFFSAWSVQAQLITGVADRTVYTDTATFNVATSAGFTYEVTLNGLPVPAGSPQTIRRMDYYDLLARRTQISDGSVVSQLIRFIVLSSNRGTPEQGLIQWTPYPPIPSGSQEFAGGQLTVVAPQNFPAGIDIPVIAWVDDGPGNGRRVNGNVLATGFPSLPLRRGVGHVLLPPVTNSGPVNYNAHIQSLAVSKVVNIDTSTTWSNVTGTLPAATVWPANSRIRVTGNITLASGSTLTIGAGAIVQLNPGVNITNSGRTVINGTAFLPAAAIRATRRCC